MKSNNRLKEMGQVRNSGLSLTKHITLYAAALIPTFVLSISRDSFGCSRIDGSDKTGSLIRHDIPASYPAEPLLL